MAGLGIGAAGVAGYLGWRKWRGSDEEVIAGGQVEPTYEGKLAGHFPAPRDTRFAYGRAETDRVEAARYTNFYEFSSFKSSWRYVDSFEPYPWTIKVTGLCRNEIQLDLADFHQAYASMTILEITINPFLRWAWLPVGRSMSPGWMEEIRKYTDPERLHFTLRGLRIGVPRLGRISK